MDVYQIPYEPQIYVQQNLITNIAEQRDTDSIHLNVNQSLSYKRILNKNLFPLTSELSINLNHSYQTSFFCTYTFQKFPLISEQMENVEISNFWYCGNSLGVTPFSASVIHPKLTVYAGTGQAFGSDSTDPQNVKTYAHTFYTLKPVIAIEINIIESIKFSLGCGYQFVSSASSKILEKNASGFEAVTTLSLQVL